MSGSSYDIKLYINDQYRATIDAGGAHALILGAYADDEPMNVKMKIMSASNTYYGTKIDYMTVSHRVVTLEIDYMVDQNQNSLVPIDDIFSMASYVRSYYIMHGYARCDYLVDDEIPWDEGTTWPSEFQQTFETYCDHKTGDYEWVFVANRGTGDYSNAWGFWDPNKPNPPHEPNYGIAIFAAHCTSLDSLKLVLMHEFGHSVGIIYWPNGEEIYCGNYYCCMARVFLNIGPNPWYCIFHWSLRDYPFTPQD